VLKQAMEKNSGEKIHGEIVAPFFLEGGRITMGGCSLCGTKRRGNDTGW